MKIFYLVVLFVEIHTRKTKCCTHIDVSLAEAAPETGSDVEEREEVEEGEDGPPLMGASVQVDCHEQLC